MKQVRQFGNKVESFLASYQGARFFNIAYSIGAAIVIWGALFKILHLPGGNALLAIGMGTEVIIFIITAFDQPLKYRNHDEYITQPIITDKISVPQRTIVTEVKPLTNENVPAIALDISKEINNEMTKVINELQRLREETEKMSENVRQLNVIYEGMISAMTAPKKQ